MSDDLADTINTTRPIDFNSRVVHLRFCGVLSIAQSVSQRPNVDRHAQLTRCFSAVAELLVKCADRNITRQKTFCYSRACSSIRSTVSRSTHIQTTATDIGVSQWRIVHLPGREASILCYSTYRSISLSMYYLSRYFFQVYTKQPQVLSLFCA